MDDYTYITNRTEIWLRPIITKREVVYSEGITKVFIHYRTFDIWGPENVLEESEFNKKFFVEYL